MATRVNIAQYLENILNAVYGEEVRSSIHDSIEALHQEVEEDVTVVTDTFGPNTLAGTAADAKAIHEQALLIRGKLESDVSSDSVDLNDISVSGVYRLISNETYINSPLTASTTGWLVVYQYGDAGRNCMQIVYETGTSSARTYSSYFRTFSQSDGWGSWQSGSFTLDSSLSLSGCAADAKAVGDRLADLEFEPISIETFEINPSKVEKGSVVNTVSYIYHLNQTPIKVRLNSTDLENNVTGGGSFTGLSLHNNKTYNLKVTGPDSPSHKSSKDSLMLELKFLDTIRWGVAPDPNNANYSALVGNLSESELSETRAKTFTITCPSGSYIWYAHPADYGVATFEVGGFTGGFELIALVSYTNSHDHSEVYYLYRSSNPSLGEQTVTVS